jgi:hypothetical protein
LEYPSKQPSPAGVLVAFSHHVSSSHLVSEGGLVGGVEQVAQHRIGALRFIGEPSRSSSPWFTSASLLKLPVFAGGVSFLVMLRITPSPRRCGLDGRLVDRRVVHHVEVGCKDAASQISGARNV